VFDSQGKPRTADATEGFSPLLQPMPVRSRRSMAFRTPGRSRCSMMNSPSGLRILLAILARYLLGPAPMLSLRDRR